MFAVPIAVFFQAADIARVQRVEPGAGRQPHHAGPHAVGHFGAREARAPVVKQTHHVAVRNTARRCVVRMDGNGLAASDLGVTLPEPGKFAAGVVFLPKKGKFELYVRYEYQM